MNDLEDRASDGFYAAKRRGQREQRQEDLKAAIIDAMCNLSDGLSEEIELSPVWRIPLHHRMYDGAHLSEICFEIRRDVLSEVDSLSKAEASLYNELWVEQVDANRRRLVDTATLFAFDKLKSDDKAASNKARVGARFLHGYYDFDVAWVEAQKNWRISFSTDNGPAESWLKTVRDNMS